MITSGTRSNFTLTERECTKGVGGVWFRRKVGMKDWLQNLGLLRTPVTQLTINVIAACAAAIKLFLSFLRGPNACFAIVAPQTKPLKTPKYLIWQIQQMQPRCDVSFLCLQTILFSGRPACDTSCWYLFLFFYRNTAMNYDTKAFGLWALLTLIK